MATVEHSVISSERLTDLSNLTQRSWLTGKYGYMALTDENSIIVAIDSNTLARRLRKGFDMRLGVESAMAQFGDNAMAGGWVDTSVTIPGKTSGEDTQRQVTAIGIFRTNPNIQLADYSHVVHDAMGIQILDSGVIFDAENGFDITDTANSNKFNDKEGFYATPQLNHGRPACVVVVGEKRDLRDAALRLNGPRAAMDSFIETYMMTPSGASPFVAEFVEVDEVVVGKSTLLRYCFTLKDGTPLPLHSADVFAGFLTDHINRYVELNAPDRKFMPCDDSDLTTLTGDQLRELIEDTEGIEGVHQARVRIREIISDKWGIDTIPTD